jgi:hypothetical protein
LLEGVPTWVEPTVGNILTGYALTKGAENVITGGIDIQKGFSEGDKQKFDEGITKITDGTTTVAALNPLGVKELSNITAPLVALSTAKDLQKDIEADDTKSGTFDMLRLINTVSGLPISRTQILPTKTVRAFKHIKPYHIRKHIESKQNKKKEQDGGIVTSLSQKEIDNLIRQGYIIEELD